MTAGRGRRAAAPLALAAAALLGLSACSGPAEDEQRRTLTVYAAASLAGSFEDLADRFEQEHPGVEVRLSSGGSSALVSQLQEGASADVLATADERTMGQAIDAGLIEGEPRIFATNTLTIAVPPGNPGGVGSFRDLSSPELDTVICEQRVPCGAATAELEEAIGADAAAVSEEGSVTDVLGKVASGQADAGVVYRTDVISAGDQVEEVGIPEADRAVNDYPIAVLKGSEETDLAGEFSELVLGETGRQRLEQEGFGTP
ncbi:molybdate ABC transporter substrate-binding protein [Kocuria palustris]|uniref:molybdate ABC transporter substrate-binding protein n=1 Tax=Kocuria palustris TaxID=71999 RepID=UPI0011A41340|nr:molybdate ABC transporter substrate-binding protein [Kocuria palustris]